MQLIRIFYRSLWLSVLHILILGPAIVCGQDDSFSIGFTVGGGDSNAPFYTFTDPNGLVTDFLSRPLYRGETYNFTANSISESHPFMIGENYGDITSDLVLGGPLTGSGDTLQVTIPLDFEGSLYYFCTSHEDMIQEFTVLSPSASYEVIDLNWSDADQAFQRGEDNFPQIRLFSNCYYNFTNHSNQRLVISTDLDSTLLSGSSVFNNASTGPEAYLLFTPKLEGSEQENFYYYNSASNANHGVLQVIPYQSFTLLESQDPQLEARFGYALSVNSVNQLIIGAYGEDSLTGKAYVYNQLDDLSYSLYQEITPPLDHQTENMKFGASVACFDEYLAVSAPDSESLEGSVFFYQKDEDEQYALVEKIVGNNPATLDTFGFSLSMSEQWLAVSSTQYGSDKGKVSLFEIDSGLTFHSNLQAGDGVINDNFGYDLDLKDNIIVVGAPGAGDTINGTDSGVAYVFGLDESGDWVQSQQIAPSSLSAGDRFGSSVRISENFIFIGAVKGDDTGVDTGVVYIFEQFDEVWTEVAVVSPPTSTADQLFSTDLESSGDLLISSSPGAGSHGLVYVYGNLEGSNDWDLISTLDLNQSTVVAGSSTHSPLAAREGMIIVGSPEESSSAAASGGIQAFYNPSWSSATEKPSLPPLWDIDSEYNFSILEDSSALTYDFNASHPFDYPITWSLAADSTLLGDGVINEVTGFFEFSPFDNESGTQKYVITSTVGELSSDQTIEITISPVNDTPEFINVDTPLHTLPVAMVGEIFTFSLVVEDVDSDLLNVSLKAGDQFPGGLTLVEGSQTGEYIITGTPSGESLSFTNGVYEHSFSLICDDSSGSTPVEQMFSLLIYPRNEPPVVTFNGLEASTVTLELTEDFEEQDWLTAIQSLDIYDPDGDGLNFTLLQAPSDGTVALENQVLDPREHIIFIPLSHAHGERSFQVRITDDDANFPKFTDLTVVIDIEGVNDAPTLLSPVPSSFANEGVLYSHVFEVFDPDENDNFAIKVDGLPSWLSLSDDNLSMTGTPSWEDYNDGIASTIFVTLEDDYGNRVEQSYFVSVIPANYPPLISGNESRIYYIDEDQNPISWPSILLTASDPDETVTSFAWSIFYQPSNGSVELVADGESVTVLYTPDGNFSGIDNFSVLVSEQNDENAKDLVSFTVVVNSIEDDPVFKSIPHYSDAVVEYPWEYKIVTEDGDVGQALTLSIDSTIPAWLSVVESQNGKAILRGIPPAGVEGEYPVELSVRDDNNNIASQSFILGVLSENTPPMLTFPSENRLYIKEDEIWRSQGERIIDPDKQKISALFEVEPKHGDLQVTINLEKELEIQYMPDGNYSGADDFSIIFTDGINTDQASFEVVIETLDDAPVFSNLPSSITISDDDDLNVTFNVLDGDSLVGMKFNASNVPDWVIIDDTALSRGIIKISGNPSHNDEGQVTVTFSAEDETQLSNSQDLQINVIVHNAPPSVEKSEYHVSMTEDLPETWVPISFSASDDHTLPEDLIWGIALSPSGGEASIEPDGSDLIYQPDSNFSGEDLFIIEVTDSGGALGSPPKSSLIEIKVDVENTSDEPVFISSPPSDKDDLISWNDESPYHYQVQAYDADGVAPTISCVSSLPSWLKFTLGENGTAILSGLASPSDIGRYQIAFEATDGSTIVEQVFDLVIRVDNYPPVFYSTLSNSPIKKVRIFMDEDGDGARGWNPPTNYGCYDPDPNEFSKEISWAVGKAPVSGSDLLVKGDGLRPVNFTYNPKPNLNGYDEFTLEASDGIRKAELKIEVYLRSIPDNPYFVKPASTFFQFQQGDQFNIEILAQDDDSADLSYKLFLPTWLDPGFANIKLLENEEGAILSGLFPEEGVGRTIPVSISAVDEGGAFDMTHFSLEVNGSNRSPIIQTGDEMSMVFSHSGEILSGNLNQLTAIDPDGDLLTWEIKPSSKPKYGEVSILATYGVVDSLTYHPDFIGAGTDSFTLYVTDGKKTDEVLINAIIVEGNEAPVISGDDNISIEPNDTLAVDFSIIHSGSGITSLLTSGPDWLKLEVISAEKIRLTGNVPDNLSGVYGVTFRVTSSNGVSASKNVSVNVTSKVPPEIHLLGEKLIQLNTGQGYSEPGYYALDHRGGDLTENVTVSPEVDYEKEGFTTLTYEVSDAQGNTAKDFRFLKIYDESPLEFAHASYLDSATQLHALLSGTETFFLAGRLTQSIHLLDASLKVEQVELPGNKLFIGELDATSKTWPWIIELEGKNVKINRLNEKSGYLYAAGVFSENLKVADKSTASNSPHSTFLIKITTSGDLLWVKTFHSNNETEDLHIDTSDDHEILLGGSFRGELYIDESITYESYDDASDIFMLRLSPSGDILHHTKFGRSGSNILSDISFSQHGAIIACNVLKVGSKPYGLALGLNSHLDIEYSISFESSNFSQCKNLTVDGTNLYLSCDYSQSLRIKTGGDHVKNTEEVIAVSEENSSVILKLSSDLNILWQNDLGPEINLSTEFIRVTPFGNIMALVSYTQEPDMLSGGVENSPKDHSIVKLQQMNGDVIWQKDILGDGDEGNATLLMNRYGTTALKITSEQGLIIDSYDLTQTQPNESLLIKFESRPPVQFKEINDLLLLGGEFFSKEISLVNRNFAEFRLVNAPGYLTLQNEGDGKATIFGVIPNREDRGTIVVQSFDLDGASSQVSIDYQIKKNNALNYSGQIPDFHSTRSIKGNGKIIEIIELDHQAKLIAGNAISAISYQGVEIQKTGIRYGFILLTDSNLSLTHMIAINSSSEAAISSVTQSSTGEIMICGTFRNDLSINNQNYVGSDGYNVFVAELSLNGEIKLLEILSSDEDLLSLSVVGSKESFTVSGQMWGAYNRGGSNPLFPRGLQDGFLAQFSSNQLQSFRPIGGTYMDQITGHVSLGNQTVISGNFDREFNWGNEVYYKDGKASFISKINGNGLEGEITILSGSGAVRSNCLLHNSVDNKFYLAGEFDGSISVGDHEVVSTSGLDIFVASFNQDLTCESLSGYGGEGTDRLTDFKISKDGYLFLSATFSKRFNPLNSLETDSAGPGTYLAKLEPSTLHIHDSFIPTELGVQKIDTISPIRENNILFAYSDDLSLSERVITLASLGPPLNQPGMSPQLPQAISSNSFFTFPFKTGPWMHDSIIAEQNSSLPDWIHLRINEDGSGSLSGQPPYSLQDIIYNVSFVLTNERGEVFSLNHPLMVKNSSVFKPRVLLKNEYAFEQYEDIEILVHSFDPDGETFVVQPNLPDWLTFSKSEANKLVISGTAHPDKIGTHPISILAVDSSGLKTEESSEIIIKPYLGENTTDAVELPGGWSRGWIGDFITTASGWSFHTTWGWVWLYPEKNTNGLWLKTNNGPWYWTNSTYWNAENNEGYLYSNSDSKWLYCRQQVQGHGAKYDYELKEWSLFP